MDKLQDMIIDSLELGMNIKILLMATGIDEETFMHYVEFNKFDAHQQKILMRIIKEWRKANAIF
jgi:hypothetical protein